jgi:hypothetical protein
MQVKDLQPFLDDLARFLETTGGKTVAKDLSRFAGGLGPFAEMTIAQLCDFLAIAEEYQRTGVLDSAKKSRGSTKQLDEQKIVEWTQRLSKLREQAISEDVTYSHIETEIKQMAKANTKPELVAISKELGLSGSYKTKKDAQTAIHRLITERKESFQRTQFGSTVGER